MITIIDMSDTNKLNDKKTCWRQKKNNTTETSLTKNSSNRKGERNPPIYNKNTELLPILERPVFINTSIPSCITPPPNITSPYKELNNDVIIKEGFGIDIDKTQEEIQKDPFKWGVKTMLYPIKIFALFNPTILTHNKYTDKFLEYLAGKDIANKLFEKASENTKIQKLLLEEVNKNKNEDQTQNIFDNIDKLAQYSLEKKKQTETIAALASDPDTTKSILDTEKAKLTNLQKQAEELGDASDQLSTGLQSICNDTNNINSITNPTLALDKALIKDYLFTTIILLFSFFTVYSWVIFLSVIGGTQSFLINIINYLTKSDNNIKLSDEIPFASMINPTLKSFFDFYRMFDPFDMTKQGLNGILIQLKRFSQHDFNNTLDKKIWFIFLFYITFLATTYFMSNYNYYMNSAINFKETTLSKLFQLLFAYYYIWGIILYPFNSWKEILGGFLLLPLILFFLIFLLLRNIYVLICLYYNQFVIIYVLLILFIIISIGGLFLFPSFKFNFMERLTELKQVINKDAELKKIAYDTLYPVEIATLTQKLYKYLRNTAHFLYDNLFFASSIIWISYMFYIFDKKIKTTNLRMNVFTILIFCIFLLIILKFIQQFLFKK